MNLYHKALLCWNFQRDFDLSKIDSWMGNIAVTLHNWLILLILFNNFVSWTLENLINEETREKEKKLKKQRHLIQFNSVDKYFIRILPLIVENF